jgi:hypothetical protein
MEDLILFLHYIFFAYAGIIGLMINMVCSYKVNYYNYSNGGKSEKWLKYQKIQLFVQVFAAIMGIVCAIIYIRL